MSKITWLHLSDLHLSGTETSVHRRKFSDMLSDIEQQREQESLDFDAVFFTGDVTLSSQIEQYTVAIELFDNILEVCGLSGKRNKLFMVPGNHDVDRKVVYSSKVRLSQHESFARNLLDSGNLYDEINDFLGDDDDKAWAFAKFGNYARFINEYYDDRDIKFNHDSYYSVRPIEKGDHKIAVIGLNSAWLSFRDDEQGKLLIGEKQVCDALEVCKKKWPAPSLRIALVHHPLYWLAEKDIHKVQQYLPIKVHILLRGHLHCPSFSVQSTPDSHLNVFAAGASLKAHYHAYNIVHLDLETREGIAIVRLQHPDIGGHWGADSFTYRNAKEGKIRFRLF